LRNLDNMPIFYQQHIDGDTRLGIWKIEEDEAFFRKKVQPQRNVTHPHKNLQHLAGRYLLRYLFPDFPVELIQIADTRKPFLEDEAFHFSISHCGFYAAAIVSRTKRVGVDIELFTDKVERIKHKFLTGEEMQLLSENTVEAELEISQVAHSGNVAAPVRTISKEIDDHFSPEISIHKLVAAWSCKESVFKWYGHGGVDFRNHIEIKSIVPCDNSEFESIIAFKKNEELFLRLHSNLFGELCLSYVIT
jgi:phosphopantetheinyl transferase